MAAKVMLKHRQLHLKINQTIFLEFLEIIKIFTYTNGLFICKAHVLQKECKREHYFKHV